MECKKNFFYYLYVFCKSDRIYWEMHESESEDKQFATFKLRYNKDLPPSKDDKSRKAIRTKMNLAKTFYLIVINNLYIKNFID